MKGEIREEIIVCFLEIYIFVIYFHVKNMQDSFQLRFPLDSWLLN